MSTNIEWTHETWNPLLGCSKVSAGCQNCYAIRTAWIRQHNPKMAERYTGIVRKTEGGKLNWTGQINLVPDALNKPVKQKKPTMYFVNSMSDLFHPNVPFEYIDKIISTISWCPQHTFQVLTKQPVRMLEYFESLKERTAASPDFLPLKNLWLGVSAEDQKTATERIPLLLRAPVIIRFLSAEPLLGPIDLSAFQGEVIGPTGDVHYRRPIDSSIYRQLTGLYSARRIDWVIVGGESGPAARITNPQWVRQLRDQCENGGIAFFFKQWGEWCDIEQMPFTEPSHDRYDTVFHQGETDEDSMYYYKLGKKLSGRLLDRVEHNNFPSPINYRL